MRMGPCPRACSPLLTRIHALCDSTRSFLRTPSSNCLALRHCTSVVVPALQAAAKAASSVVEMILIGPDGRSARKARCDLREIESAVHLVKRTCELAGEEGTSGGWAAGIEGPLKKGGRGREKATEGGGDGAGEEQTMELAEGYRYGESAGTDHGLDVTFHSNAPAAQWFFTTPRRCVLQKFV
eukprot:5153886-Pleurochrysis_carterae.AAC.3